MDVFEDHSQVRSHRLAQALQQVVDAWTVQGPNPEYHRIAQDKLLKQWPRLANALIDLEKIYEE